MRIESLHLINFRCFRDNSIRFDDRLTVILADNGLGKTALLDALAIGFSRIFGRFPQVSGVALKEPDLRLLSEEQTYPFTVLAFSAKTGTGEMVHWSALRRRDNAVKAESIMKALGLESRSIVLRGLKEAHAYADNLITKENEGRAPVIPVFSYYGTNRAVRSEIHRRRGSRKKFSRFEALQGAFEATSQFRAAFEWYSAMEDQERREKVDRRDFNYTIPVLDAVRLAVKKALPVGYSNLRTESRPLRFLIDFKQPGRKLKTFRITQLSDGYRTVLALVMDYARRLVQAYPLVEGKRPKPEKVLGGCGIALIDEVDLHLHPQWQQTIVPILLETFPGTQFIITTHSPQVITTVPAHCLRKLELHEGRVEIREDFNFSEGAEAQYVLEDIQGVPARPHSIQAVRDLDKYLQLVHQDKWDSPEALALRETLDQWGHGYEPALTKADVDIRLREFRRKKS